MIIIASADSVDAVVDTVARTVCTLVRHNLGDGIAISYLFDGDENRPRTCQWRLIATSENELRKDVQKLLECLASLGVSYDAPRFFGTVCYLVDRGPWSPSPPNERTAPDQNHAGVDSGD